MLEQTLSDGVWYNNKAWRLRDNLPIEPPFPPSGHCWVIINTADPLKDGDICYAFSCYDTARSAADSAPQHLSGQLAVEEALTYTPWAAPYKPHTVRPFSKDLYHED